MLLENELFCLLQGWPTHLNVLFASLELTVVKVQYLAVIAQLTLTLGKEQPNVLVARQILNIQVCTVCNTSAETFL